MRVLLSFIALIMALCANGQYQLSLTITTDQFPMETTWSITGGGEMLMGGGDYNYAYNQYEHQMPVEPGSYVFTIEDSADDGICCGYGDGFFVLSETTSNTVIAEGGEFGSLFQYEFSIPYEAPDLGCTDPIAINFNALADLDDGTCLYSTSPVELSLQQVASGFDDLVGIISAGVDDDRFFLVEQGGTIRVMNADYTTESAPFLNISSLTDGGGEQGLLGLAFHPDYANNGYFFVHYTNNAGDSRVARYSVSDDNPNVADPSSAEIILSQDQPYSNHNAGDIAFGPDGYLYIPFGDGGSGGDPDNYAQNLQSWLGKMLRIDVDNGSPYSIPTTNPFTDDDFVLDEIWSIGLRNTWKFSFDALTGDMWMADVGQNAWEEIDFEIANTAGLNYGWRCKEGLVNYNTSQCNTGLNLVDPVAVYNHSGGACSVTGGYVYRGNDFSNMYGKYFFTDYCNGQFRYLTPNGDGTFEMSTTMEPQGFGWSCFGESNTNELYVGNLNGNVYRLVDECDGFSVELTQDDGALTASAGESYVWYLDGEAISGATGQTYTPTSSGTYTVIVFNEEGCSALSNEEVVVTSITELAAYGVKVGPNPVEDFLRITWSGRVVDRLLVINMMGQIVHEEIPNADGTEVEVAKWESGVYTINLFKDNQSIGTSQVVIQR